MTTPPAGISDADWAATPVGVRSAFLEALGQLQRQRQEIQALQQENEQLRQHLTAMATELVHLRDRIGRSSRNSSKPRSSDGLGFKPSERRKSRGPKRGGQQGHPGARPELLPIERVAVSSDIENWRTKSGCRLTDRTPAAPVGLPLLLHQHLRGVAGGCGSQLIRAPAQCLGGAAG